MGSHPLGVAVSPTGPEAGYIYVTNEISNMVWVINPATDTVVATIHISSPAGVAVSPTGPEAGDVFVANYLHDGTLSVIS